MPFVVNGNVFAHVKQDSRLGKGFSCAKHLMFRLLKRPLKCGSGAYKVSVSVHMSRVVRKLAFCICENKGADKLRGNREADHRLCFRYTDSLIPLLPKSEISSLSPISMAAQPGLCRTRSKNPKTGFLTTRHIQGLVILK